MDAADRALSTQIHASDSSRRTAAEAECGIVTTTASMNLSGEKI
ncbi:hypothetical protein L083_6248 [Actinoplanes sp. N902-109]|nr:hypothetical protein L083_6248 [Actinoplanes sp. N902-109]